ncbi:ATP-binding cassette domain-containing protein [Mammaliicoccus sciuri]|uniref:ATP-binding cassette domain-containing protein n=1 Tax=Mammaliicoccus sciuri TaxID=1296 RepID=UPI00265C3546|nr:ATP-binding cassette domain-containing protein [Mammaliicoccus sciuri]MDO0953304.1 ATP-binding cassette domain-containing protein [Mammaliicoccus sciuri]
MYYVKNLKYTYKNSDKAVLSNISFDLKRDRLNVLIGMNGAGKTTLFDCITNHLKAEYDEINMPKLNDISFLTQYNYYAPNNTGEDLIKLFLGIIPKDEKKKFKDHFIKVYPTSKKRNMIIY